MSRIAQGVSRRTRMGLITVIVCLGLLAPEAVGATDPPPVINSFVGSSTSLAPGGGTVTFNAVTTGANTCSVDITPAISSPPAEWACAGDATSTHVTFTIPPSVKKVSYSVRFTATAQFSDGTTAAAVVTAFIGKKGYDYYQAKSSLRTSPTTPTGLSCAVGLCAASATGGYVGTITPTTETWVHLDGTATFNSVSCVSKPSLFCAAVDTLGNAALYSAGHWHLVSAPAGSHATLSAVACGGGPTIACLAVGNPNSSGSSKVTVFGGASFARLHTIYIIHRDLAARNVASCSTSTFCIVVDGAGGAATWSGGSTMTTLAAFPPNGLPAPLYIGVSCSPGGTCMGLTSSGASVILLRLRKRPDHLFQAWDDLSALGRSISCPLDDLCFTGHFDGSIDQPVPSTITVTPTTLSDDAITSSLLPLSGPVLVSCAGTLTSTSMPQCTALAAMSRHPELTGHVTLIK